MIQITSAQPQKQEIPSREKLELYLKNGVDMIDMVQLHIDKFKLPYVVEISNGINPINGKVYPEGFGVLVDTLSAGELHLQTFITEDPDTKQMKEDARRMAVTPYEVLIVGDTGTGKETIARSMIADRKGPIKAINCAGMPSELIESELFGHVRGAFTGATSEKIGLMTDAKDGVFFLDEIGELPLHVQAKLLRSLQEKRIRKVGSLQDEAINCKFVAATNKDLKKMVTEGTFRKDLYARISTLELHINPLWKDRVCDIIPITRHIVQTMKLKRGEEFISNFGNDLVEGVLEVPLNVRSLQQYVIRYEVLGRIKK